MEIEHAPSALIRNMQAPGLANTLDKTPRQLFIDGKFVDAHGGATMDAVNTRTGKAMATVAAAQPADVDAAVQAARQAFDAGRWPRMTGKERALKLRKWAGKMQLYEPEVALLESVDTGKPLHAVKHIDVPFAISLLEHYAGWADGKIYGETVPLGVSNAWGYTLHEPRGVCGAILPCKFPLATLVGKIAPALAAGCTTVIKVSEDTPMSALYVTDLCLLADIPAGVVNIIPGKGDVAGAALAAHPGIDHLSFTGSAKVGKLVAAAAARNVGPCTLELGGESSIVVWKDVDVYVAVEQSHFAALLSSGRCTTASSIFVHKDIHDEFVAKAAARAQSAEVGDTLDPGTRDTAPAQEEVPGTAHIIMVPYNTLDEVIERANATPCGLAAGVLAKDIDVINTLTRSLKYGTVWVNSFGARDVAMPYGGYKQSGIGREGGSYGLQPYINVKAVYASLKSAPWR